MANTDFPRILTLLRKEKGISQKLAAKQLGVSQALLSHYEKGIRECGLAFVLRAADFYEVSCDYLLGRSPERQGKTLDARLLNEPSSDDTIKNQQAFLAVYQKKLLFSSLNILYDLIAKSENKRLISEVSSFLSLAVYRMIRVVFCCNKHNKEEMFRVPSALSYAKAQSKMLLHEANAGAIANRALPKELAPVSSPEKLAMNMEVLDQVYPSDKSAFLNLVKNCETNLSDSEK